jgi:cytochrome c-type biogenesis protein CcmF
MNAYATAEKMVAGTVMDVSRGGHHVATLHPQRNFHIAQSQAQSEIALRSTPAEDLYIVLTDINPASGDAVVRAWVNPLVAWIWLGGLVMAAGMVIILTGRSPAGPPETVPSERRRRREAVPV